MGAVGWAALHCRNPTQLPAAGSTWIQAPVLFAPPYSCIKLSIATTPQPGSEQQLCWDRAAAASWFVWYHCCIPLLAAGLPHSDARPSTNRSKMLMGEGEKKQEKTEESLGAAWRWHDGSQRELCHSGAVWRRGPRPWDSVTRVSTCPDHS